MLCKELGPPEKLVVEEVPALKPGKGQVVVSVKAAGVNFPDTLIIQGKYQFKPEPPFSPGGEVAGVIKALGEGVTGWKPGERVIAGSTWGGFAQEIVVEADRLLRMPERMDFVSASAFLLTYGTSYHALKDRAQTPARRDAAGARRLGRCGAFGHPDRQGDGRPSDRRRLQRRKAGGVQAATAPTS